MRNISESARKYLSVLNLPLEIPTFHYLERICHAHLNTFPFENISKLLYFRDRNRIGFDIPPFDIFVENYIEYHFGGTCYTLNSSFKRLLTEIGFECYHIMLGKEHMGIIVIVDQERVYVDCGAAAPFFKPVRFESDHQNISQFGKDEVYLLPVRPQNYEYQYIRYVQGKQNGKVWEFNSTKACQVNDFTEAIIKSNQPGSSFMTILRCQRWQTGKNRSVSLVNNKFGIRYADGQTSVTTLKSTEEIQAVIAEEFMLPKLPVSEAIAVLKQLNVDIFSESV
jgi:arylamine N-acetyltransferase